jgi:two-component system chemotaxis sensor kinase CheA
LARELGKKVEVIFDVGTAEATGEVLAAVDTAVLHLVRNAIDHGIELPDERTRAGKSAHGTIRVHCGAHGDEIIATVTDDGRGVPLDEVRARAIDLGWITPDDADLSTRWFDLVCQPGFTTRTEASDVSGRGVGLDAVRVGIQDVGGTLTATTTQNRGTAWRIAIPVPKMTIEAHVLRVPGASFPFVIDTSWKLGESVEGAPVVDLAYRLGLTEERLNQPTRYFTRGDKTIGIVTDRATQIASVRRLLIAPLPSIADIVLVEAVEGLLLHVDRLGV